MQRTVCSSCTSRGAARLTPSPSPLRDGASAGPGGRGAGAGRLSPGAGRARGEDSAEEGGARGRRGDPRTGSGRGRGRRGAWRPRTRSPGRRSDRAQRRPKAPGTRQEPPPGPSLCPPRRRVLPMGPPDPGARRALVPRSPGCGHGRPRACGPGLPAILGLRGLAVVRDDGRPQGPALPQPSRLVHFGTVTAARPPAPKRTNAHTPARRAAAPRPFLARAPRGAL